MKKRIKLRDMTAEQWDNYQNKCTTNCRKCVFGTVNCQDSEYKDSWFNNKDLFSDKFLDQEIEIYDILTKEEKEYLSAVIKPFRDRVIFIKKTGCTNDKYFIGIEISSKLSSFGKEMVCLQLFQNEMYKGMENNKDYTLKDLGL